MNKVYTGDNIHILRSLPNFSVDLIYADPPFNTGKDWYAFDDKWSSMDSYIEWLENRMYECKKLLKDSGSIYLHCDQNASHYIKVMMDRVFGVKQFKNDIIWKRTTAKGNTKKKFGVVSDSILFYGSGYINRDDVKVPYDEDYLKEHYTLNDNDGRGIYRSGPLRPPGGNGHFYEINGVPGPWRYKEDKMNALIADNRIIIPEKGVPRSKIYLSETKGKTPDNIWLDISNIQGASIEATGYPTQKPLKLLERIIKASSNKGDIVLDPFCGSGTTLVAAKSLGRNYIGIDENPTAVKLAEERLK